MGRADYYTFRIERGAGGDWNAWALEFPGLSASAGAPEEVLDDLFKMIGDEMLRRTRDNEPVPVPFAHREYSGKFLTRLPADLHRDLTVRAASEGVSLNALVVAVLARYVSSV